VKALERACNRDDRDTTPSTTSDAAAKNDVAEESETQRLQKPLGATPGSVPTGV